MTTRTMLDELASLRCPDCGRAVRVSQDRPLVDAESLCLLAVRCACGYQADVEAVDADGACAALLRRVQSSAAGAHRPPRSPYNPRALDPLSPYPATV